MSFFSDMAPIIGGALGGAILGPVGGAVGTGIGGSISDNQNRKDQAELDAANWSRNVEAQREFAKHGIRWKVEDAKAAGIHPLVGLGAQSASFSPISIGSTSQPSSLASMGQDVGRAIAATGTQADREMSTLSIQGAKLDLEGKALDNQIKNSQLQKLNATGPAFPNASGNFISGQGNSGPAIIEKPFERTTSMPGNPHSEPGAIPDVGWAKTATGVVPIPSNDVKQRIEDNMPQEWMHYYRNNISQNFDSGPKPREADLPKGYDYWKWSIPRQEYQPARRERSSSPGDNRSWYAKPSRNSFSNK